MISVENFYYILYANLLRPCGIDCWYYYPFGTTQNFSANDEFGEFRPKYEYHVLFHFDQEPIYTESLGKQYDGFQNAYSNKILKILANSEHSQLKKDVCKNRSMLDWYFFYHGFAALDWFRDAAYLGCINSPQKVFSSYNHLVTHKRSYRMSLTARLVELDLLSQGDISFHGSLQDCKGEIDCEHTELSYQSKLIIEQAMLDNHHLPFYLDNVNLDGAFSARLGHQEYQLWQNSLLHVVNETVFYDKKLHLTEKIFKPIVALRPFILVAAPGNLAYLKHYGFQTFDRWIDESYDNIDDPDLRLDAIAREVAKLCSLSAAQLDDLFNDMRPVLTYNKNHFFGKFRSQITDELVDNFDACVRIWNNGRLDASRLVNQSYDLQQVKRLLMS